MPTIYNNANPNGVYVPKSMDMTIEEAEGQLQDAKTKRCKVCGQEKPADEFPKTGSGATTCAGCRSTSEKKAAAGRKSAAKAKGRKVVGYEEKVPHVEEADAEVGNAAPPRDLPELELVPVKLCEGDTRLLVERIAKEVRSLWHDDHTDIPDARTRRAYQQGYEAAMESFSPLAKQVNEAQSKGLVVEVHIYG